MLKILYGKLKEALFSVLPVTAIVFILSMTPLINLQTGELIIFSVCSVLLFFGIGLFNLGADLAMMPMGEFCGAGLVRHANIKLLLAVSFLMGLFITVAEPDLSVLAGQVSTIMNSTALIWTVGIGVGIFLLLAVIKIVFKLNLSMLLMFFYMIAFMIAALLIEGGKAGLLPMSFDSGGVTTGPITVPFIMAFGVGIAQSVKGKSSENAFGLIALCSIGPIVALLALSLGSSGTLDYKIPENFEIPENVFGAAVKTLLNTSIEVGRALLLILAIFLILQFTVLKLPRKRLKNIYTGMVYTFLGLVIFLSSVSIGFMPIGYKIGTLLAQQSKTVIIVFGFVIGALVVLAEPAVHVLKKQVEEITNGTVSKRSMLIALSVGVGTSLALSLIRIIFDFSILWYLIPGYIISLGLSFFVPRLYTSMAFDSGGVASGPLTSTFILPFAIGVCDRLYGESEVMSLAFGIVAMVAMTPLITIQALGFRALMTEKLRQKITMKRIISADDEQIIYFK
jgi:hypothetical protein